MVKKLLFCFFLATYTPFIFAGELIIGQTIQIHTRLHAFVGKPTWLLIVRDLDNNQNLPFLYDIKKGNQYWLALTYGNNYLITVSSLKFYPYEQKIDNFCHLESNGRIIRGESLYISISGFLSPNTNTFSCHVLRFKDPNFAIDASD